MGLGVDGPVIATDTDFEGDFDGYTIEDNEGNAIEEFNDDDAEDYFGDDEE